MTETSDEMDVLAAEYVLRLLPVDEMEDATQRNADDPDFAAAVMRWEARLVPLANDLEEVVPRAAVKDALLERLFPEAATGGFWSGVAFWRGLALASVVLLAGMVWMNLSQNGSEAGPIYVAEIVSAEKDFRVIAVVDKQANEVILTKTAGAAPEGRILQVWAHGPNKPATSVGLWPEGNSVRLAMPAEIASVVGVLTVGVSEEPIGGSPTGSPTGRVFGTVDIPDVTAFNDL